MAEGKDRFRNQTGGYVGVNVYDDDHKRNAVSVEPGGVVELSKAEQQMTADAPRDPKDNPFIGGWRDGEGKRIGPALVPAEANENRRPTRPTGETEPEEETEEETASEQGEPETGVAAPGEVVATPDAPAKRAAARKRTPVKS